MKTASQLTPKELEAYRRSALRVRPRANKEIRARRLRAWRVARKAAKILKKEFGADKVMVFGSLLQPSLFHSKSDVDLAVWGVKKRSITGRLVCCLTLIRSSAWI